MTGPFAFSIACQQCKADSGRSITFTTLSSALLWDVLLQVNLERYNWLIRPLQAGIRQQSGD
jgi:hypothetical protein